MWRVSPKSPIDKNSNDSFVSALPIPRSNPTRHKTQWRSPPESDRPFRKGGVRGSEWIPRQSSPILRQLLWSGGPGAMNGSWRCLVYLILSIGAEVADRHPQVGATPHRMNLVKPLRELFPDVAATLRRKPDGVENDLLCWELDGSGDISGVRIPDCPSPMAQAKALDWPRLVGREVVK